MVDPAVASSASGGVIRQNRFGFQYRDPFASNRNRGKSGGGGSKRNQGTTVDLAEQARIAAAIDQVNNEAAAAEAAAKREFNINSRNARGIEGRLALNKNFTDTLNSIRKEVAQRIENLNNKVSNAGSDPRLGNKNQGPDPRKGIPKSATLPDPKNKGRIVLTSTSQKVGALTESVNQVLNTLISDQRGGFVNQVVDVNVPTAGRGGTTPTRAPRASDENIVPLQRLDLTLKEIQTGVATGAISARTAQDRANRAQQRYEIEQAKANIGRNVARGFIGTLLPGAALIGGAQLGLDVANALRFRPKINKKAVGYEIGAYAAGGFLAGGLLAGARGAKASFKASDFEGEPVRVSGSARERFIAEAGRLSNDPDLDAAIQRSRSSDLEVYDVPLKDGRTYRIVQFRKGESSISGEGLGPEISKAGFVGFELIPQAGKGSKIGRRIVGASEGVAGELKGSAYTRAIILKPQGTRISRLLDRLPGRNRAEVVNILEKIETLSNKQNVRSGTAATRSTTRVLEQNMKKLALIERASALADKAQKGNKLTTKEIHEVFNLDRLSRGKEPFSEAEFNKGINERVVDGTVDRIFTRYSRAITDRPNFRRVTFDRRSISSSSFSSGSPKALTKGKKLAGTKIMRDFGTKALSLVERYKAAQAKAGKGTRALLGRTQRATTRLFPERTRPGTASVRAVISQAERQRTRFRTASSFVNAKSGALATSMVVRNRNVPDVRIREGSTFRFGNEKTSSGVGLRDFQELGTGTRLKFFTRGDSGSGSSFRTRQSPFTAAAETQVLGQPSRSKFAQKARQEQKAREAQRSRGAQQLRPRSRSPTKLKLPLRVRIPSSDDAAFKSRKRGTFFKGPKKFEGFVRRKGKFFSVTKTPTTRRAALGQALKVADTTLGASVLVRESKRPGFSRDLRAERSTTGLLRKFGPSKRDSGILVEKSRFRLEKRGRTPEVREIRGFRRRR